MGGAPGCDGVVTTVWITSSRASVGVHRPDAPLDFVSLRLQRHPRWHPHQPYESLSASSVACIVVARSAVDHTFTIIWMGAPSTSVVVDGARIHDLVTPQMHYHRCLDSNAVCIHGGARATSTALDNSGLTTTIGVPPLRRALWQRYSTSGTTTLGPLPL
jgi:hypothetical protein